MRAAIFSGGTLDEPFVKSYLKEYKPDCILAADRGLEFCHRNRIRPDIILGDFDSIDPEVIRTYEEGGGIPIRRFNPVKDTTDTAIAMEQAAEMGAGEICFFGATGTRLDHTLSNIYNLYLLTERGIRGQIVDTCNRITLPAEKEILLKKEEQFGKYVSCFPFGREVRGLTLEGFRYPLKEYTLTLGDGGLSVSNEILGDPARISYREGRLILVESRD